MDTRVQHMTNSESSFVWKIPQDPSYCETSHSGWVDSYYKKIIHIIKDIQHATTQHPKQCIFRYRKNRPVKSQNKNQSLAQYNCTVIWAPPTHHQPISLNFRWSERSSCMYVHIYSIADSRYMPCTELHQQTNPVQKRNGKTFFNRIIYGPENFKICLTYLSKAHSLAPLLIAVGVTPTQPPYLHSVHSEKVRFPVGRGRTRFWGFCFWHWIFPFSVSLGAHRPSAGVSIHPVGKFARCTPAACLPNGEWVDGWPNSEP